MKNACYIFFLVCAALFLSENSNAQCAPFNLGHDTTYCGSFSRVLKTGLVGTIWSTGDTASQITVTAAGTYWAVDSCGTHSDTIVLSLIPYPGVSFGQDTTACNGSELVLSALNPGASYQWQDNSTASTFTVMHAGTYSVIVTQGGCSALHSVTVTYKAPPLSFSIGSDTTICADGSITLSAYQNGVSYHWSTGDSTSFITVNQAGHYIVTDSNACGKVTDSIIISTKPCACSLLIPTAFSPNNDGKNDLFGVVYRCPVQVFNMSIFNRWGQVVFSGHDVFEKWDGTYKGVSQPMDVYIYAITYTDPYTLEEKTLKGNVTLLR